VHAAIVRPFFQSGNGFPFVSGASQINAIPSKYTSVTTAPARA
jgi:hypothetical protein